MRLPEHEERSVIRKITKKRKARICKESYNIFFVTASKTDGELFVIDPQSFEILEIFHDVSMQNLSNAMLEIPFLITEVPIKNP